MNRRLMSNKSRMTSAQLARIEMVFDLIPVDGSMMSEVDIRKVLINDKGYNPEGLSKPKMRSRIAANLRILELDE